MSEGENEITVLEPRWVGVLTCNCCGEKDPLPMANLAPYTDYFCRDCLMDAIIAIDRAVSEGRKS